VKNSVVSKKTGLFFLKTFRISICVALMSASSFSEVFGQTEEEEDKPNYTNAEEGPIYVSFGPNISKIYGKEFPVKFDYQQAFEGGLWLKYLIFDELPFYGGLEFQRRGYTINQIKKGTTPNGKIFEDRIKGNVILNYLSIPCLIEVPIFKPEKRFQVLAGLGLGLRIYYREKFEGGRLFPQDSLFIPIAYEKTGNDALDFMEFNLCFGLKYKVLPRMELLAMGSIKGAGLSLSKENFFTTTELSNVFSIKLLYTVTNLDNLPFF